MILTLCFLSSLTLVTSYLNKVFFLNTDLFGVLFGFLDILSCSGELERGDGGDEDDEDDADDEGVFLFGPIFLVVEHRYLK